MEIILKPGKYIVAVSGGVDSIVLLDLLSRANDHELIVAHFDHGIRDESSQDRDFVKSVAEKYKLNFESADGKLGPSASEDTARRARYAFLQDLLDKYEAEAILTAHHQDDLIETALINIMRGTGTRGLFAINDNEKIKRPLIGIPKSEILSYAQENKLDWREDSTNNELKYLRNRLRKQLTARLSDQERQQILEYIQKAKDQYNETSTILQTFSEHVFIDENTLKRSTLIFLPNEVCLEILSRWLRQHGISVSSGMLNRLVIALKTGRGGSRYDINKSYKLELGTSTAQLANR